MIRAVYSVVWPATASSTRTPVARFLWRSYTISVTIANGLSVSRPVAMAGGNVEDCVLKYPPYGQPSQQALRYWQGARPVSGFVRFAVRPGMMRRRPPKRPLSRSATTASPQLRGMAGWNCPSGSCGIPSRDPEIPAWRST